MNNFSYHAYLRRANILLSFIFLCLLVIWFIFIPRLRIDTETTKALAQNFEFGNNSKSFELENNSKAIVDSDPIRKPSLITHGNETSAIIRGDANVIIREHLQKDLIIFFESKSGSSSISDKDLSVFIDNNMYAYIVSGVNNITVKVRLTDVSPDRVHRLEVRSENRSCSSNYILKINEKAENIILHCDF